MDWFWNTVGGAMDWMVAPSFGAPGFEVRKNTWRDDIPSDLSHRAIVITGANKGIGFSCADALAARGATLHLVCRDDLRGKAALKALKAEHPKTKLHLHIADMSDASSVQGLAKKLRRVRSGIDTIIHNAGALFSEHRTTRDARERTLALHVLGPARLTRALRDRLLKKSNPRVIFVSSGGMYLKALDLDGLEMSETGFDGTLAYAHAKRVQVELARAWQEREDANHIRFYSMHPGWVKTDGVIEALPGFYRITNAILRTPEQGADTIAWLAASEPWPESGFYFDREKREPGTMPGTSTTAEERVQLFKKIMEWSEAPKD